MSIQELLQKLKVEYLAGLSERIKEIDGLLIEKNAMGLHTCFHKLKGSGKTYGVPEISQLCAVLEPMVEVSAERVYENSPIVLELLIEIKTSHENNKVLHLDTDQRFQKLLSLQQK